MTDWTSRERWSSDAGRKSQPRASARLGRLLTALLVVNKSTFSVPDMLVDSVPTTETEVIRPVPDNAPSTPFQTVLPKTVESSSMRVVFYVGLEGAGHHYFDASMASMFEKYSNELVTLEMDGFDMGDFFLAKTMTGSPATYVERYDHAVDGMRELAREGSNLPAPGTLVFLRGYSYPSFNGPEKVFQYIDVQNLAAVADAEGVDFRVVYLKRPARKMLLSNTVHRDFHLALHDGFTGEEAFMHYARILFTDTAVMHSLLAELDPAFVVCHNYDLLGDVDQAYEIANFVSPSAEVAALVEASLIDTVVSHEEAEETFPYPHVDAVVARLQQKLNAFEYKFCG